MIHVFPWVFRVFTMVFCFDRFSEPLQRDVPELGAWILCHPTSTTWQTGQICVCRKKKGSPCKNAQKYRTLLNIIINYAISYYYNLLYIYYWQWLRVPVCPCLSNSLSSLLSLAVTASVLTLLTEALGQLLQAFLHDLHLLGRTSTVVAPYCYILLCWKCC